MLTERSRQQLNCGGNPLIKVERLEPNRVPARKGEQTTREAGAHVYCIHRTSCGIKSLLVAVAQGDYIQVA